MIGPEKKGSDEYLDLIYAGVFLQQEQLITLGHISYSTMHTCHDLHDIIRHICNTVYSKIRFRHRMRGFPIRLYYVQIWRIIVSNVKT